MEPALLARVQHIMKEGRTRLSFSQSFVAKCLGISKQQYSKLENGMAMISLPHWIAFCRLLELDYNCIFYELPDKTLTDLPPHIDNQSYRPCDLG